MISCPSEPFIYLARTENRVFLPRISMIFLIHSSHPAGIKWVTIVNIIKSRISRGHVINVIETLFNKPPDLQTAFSSYRELLLDT